MAVCRTLFSPLSSAARCSHRRAPHHDKSVVGFDFAAAAGGLLFFSRRFPMSPEIDAGYRNICANLNLSGSSCCDLFFYDAFLVVYITGSLLLSHETLLLHQLSGLTKLVNGMIFLWGLSASSRTRGLLLLCGRQPALAPLTPCVWATYAWFG